MNGVIGHQSILNFFSSVLNNGTLHHAYAFVGPRRVGRRRVAEELAAALLKIEPKRLGVAPDFFLLTKGINEKTGKEKQEIGVADMRLLKEFLERRPFMGGYKIAIIDDADSLNEHSANALLKTLEEPTAKTVLFLILEDEASLPGTILSRCHSLFFSPVPERELQPLLVGRTDAEAQEMLILSRGAPGRLVDWLKSPEDFADTRDEIKRFYSLRGSSFGQKIAAVEDLFEETDEHESARNRLQEVLDLWEYAARESLLRSGAGIQLIDTIRRTRGLLQDNIHPRLLVENILLSIH